MNEPLLNRTLHLFGWLCVAQGVFFVAVDLIDLLNITSVKPPLPGMGVVLQTLGFLAVKASRSR